VPLRCSACCLAVPPPNGKVPWAHPWGPSHNLTERLSARLIRVKEVAARLLLSLFRKVLCLSDHPLPGVQVPVASPPRGGYEYPARRLPAWSVCRDIHCPVGPRRTPRWGGLGSPERSRGTFLAFRSASVCRGVGPIVIGSAVPLRGLGPVPALVALWAGGTLIRSASARDGAGEPGRHPKRGGGRPRKRRRHMGMYPVDISGHRLEHITEAFWDIRRCMDVNRWKQMQEAEVATADKAVLSLSGG